MRDAGNLGDLGAIDDGNIHTILKLDFCDCLIIFDFYTGSLYKALLRRVNV